MCVGIFFITKLILFQYGYTLPTEADSMLFYNVHFPISQSSPSDFLYPDLCLVVDKFLKLECDEMKEDIAVEFLSALKSDLQSVCGTPTEITLCQVINLFKCLLKITKKSIVSDCCITWLFCFIIERQ